ncbi:MAG: NupC/NupG family nucleoside CNT transporter [Isosphaeraceae bacterium]
MSKPLRAALLAFLLSLPGGSAVRAQAQRPPDPEPAAAAVAPRPAEGPAPGERYRGLLGIAAILGVALLLSENRRRISPRVVLWGLALQWGFAMLVLRWPAGQEALKTSAEFIKGVLASADEGAAFVFGKDLVDPGGPVGFVFAFRVLPTIIFVSALFAVLYYLRLMQPIVHVLAWVMARLMGASGAESLNVAASLFLGQTEAPLTIRPYLPRLTRSELLTVMTAGMAHVSGGIMAAYIAFGIEARHILTAVIMTAPGTILLAKILVPETEEPETRGSMTVARGADPELGHGEAKGSAGDPEIDDANVLDAAARGTREGLNLAINIAAMLIAFISLIFLANTGLGWVGERFGRAELSLQYLLGWALAPIAWLLGVPWQDSPQIGALLGTRTVLNELIAFGELGKLKESISDRSFTIATYALCGFANISSIGIQVGGIGALVPSRRADLARLGARAMLAGTLANFLSASIAGILVP